MGVIQVINVPIHPKSLKEKSSSQTWLAKQLNESYNTISEYARNVSQPSIEDLYRIAKILDINPKDLLKEE